MAPMRFTRIKIESDFRKLEKITGRRGAQRGDVSHGVCRKRAEKRASSRCRHAKLRARAANQINNVLRVVRRPRVYYSPRGPARLQLAGPFLCRALAGLARLSRTAARCSLSLVACRKT